MIGVNILRQNGTLRHFDFCWFVGFVEMEQVLLLNITYEPLKVINWKRAIIMLTLGKVEVLEEYSKEIHSVSFAIKLLSLIHI